MVLLVPEGYYVPADIDSGNYRVFLRFVPKKSGIRIGTGGYFTGFIRDIGSTLSTSQSAPGFCCRACFIFLSSSRYRV